MPSVLVFTVQAFASTLGIPVVDINSTRNGLLWSSLIEDAWEAWHICFTYCPNVQPGCRVRGCCAGRQLFGAGKMV